MARYACQGLKNGQWANLTEMNEPREFGSATVISADDKEYLLMTGNIIITRVYTTSFLKSLILLFLLPREP